MERAMTITKYSLRKLWWWAREVTGDAAYENYLAHRRAAPPTPAASESVLMTRAQFYADSLRRKYSSISRCC
jgi:uncharacterized short protein YbdD (DUF466 family)